MRERWRHPYRVREIAQQAGLREATIDRVVHERPGVRASTRAEVRQAIADLMLTPKRFSDAVRAALEAELPS